MTIWGCESGREGQGSHWWDSCQIRKRGGSRASLSMWFWKRMGRLIMKDTLKIICENLTISPCLTAWSSTPRRHLQSLILKLKTNSLLQILRETTFPPEMAHYKLRPQCHPIKDALRRRRSTNHPQHCTHASTVTSPKAYSSPKYYSNKT